MSNARVARLLEDPSRRRLLLSLVAEERSLKDVAGMNGLPLNLAHYHLGRLIRAELVEITREQKRPGRPIRFYRSRYGAFFVPAALLRRRPAEKLARNLADALEDSRVRSGSGVLFDVDASGGPRMQEIAGEGPLPFEILRRLKLSRRDAAALFDELVSVVHRYEGTAARGRAAWTIHLALGQVSN